jgi:hypothetical protein
MKILELSSYKRRNFRISPKLLRKIVKKFELMIKNERVHFRRIYLFTAPPNKNQSDFYNWVSKLEHRGYNVCLGELKTKDYTCGKPIKRDNKIEYCNFPGSIDV